MMTQTCNPSYPGSRGRRIVVQGRPGKKYETLSEKQAKVKRAEGVPQVVEGSIP
jgi:hypothetical protein